MHFLGEVARQPAAAWQLVNQTRGLVLAKALEPALDSATRRRGLLGRDSLDASTALAIAPTNAIHTFGMKFPIDVLFVDRGGKVLKRVTGLKRGRIALHLRAAAVFEFRANHPGARATEPGDRLVVQAVPTADGG